MIAAFRNLDVRRVTRRRQNAGRGFVVKIVRQIGNGTVPRVARKPALGGASLSLGSGLEDLEWRTQSWRRCHTRCHENPFQLSCANHGINLWNIRSNLVAETLHQTTSDYQFSSAPIGFVLCHFQNCVYRLLLRARDERAGVDHDNVGFFSVRDELGAGVRQ